MTTLSSETLTNACLNMTGRDECRTEAIPAAPETVLSDTHCVACHLMHPRAPKVTREV